MDSAVRDLTSILEAMRSMGNDYTDVERSFLTRTGQQLCQVRVDESTVCCSDESLSCPPAQSASWHSARRLERQERQGPQLLETWTCDWPGAAWADAPSQALAQAEAVADDIVRTSPSSPGTAADEE